MSLTLTTKMSVKVGQVFSARWFNMPVIETKSYIDWSKGGIRELFPLDDWEECANLEFGENFIWKQKVAHMRQEGYIKFDPTRDGWGKYTVLKEYIIQ